MVICWEYCCDFCRVYAPQLWQTHDASNISVYDRKEHEKCEFDVHEVYAVDVLISTGEGKVQNANISIGLSNIMQTILFALFYDHLVIWEYQFF